MDKITTLNTLKNVFSALGAKTSDSNYAVGLFDKTSGEPKGMMGMANLASVLGAFGTLQSLSNVDISGEGRPTSTGIYALNQCTGIPTDISSNSYLRLTVIAYQSDRIMYLLQNPNNGASYYRFWSGQWNASWSRNDCFGCNTTSELASALGGVGSFTMKYSGYDTMPVIQRLGTNTNPALRFKSGDTNAGEISIDAANNRLIFIDANGTQKEIVTQAL